MQISRPNRFAKSLAESMKKIEDQCFFDLDFFLRTLESPNASALTQQGVNPHSKARDQQPEENIWPHEVVASLLHRRLMEVLL